MQKKNTVFCLVGLVFMVFIAFNGCDTTVENDNGNNNGNGNSGTGDNGSNNGNNGTGNNGGNKGFLELARMDIEDANTVFIAPKPETSKDELYKITGSGKVEEVAYFDEAEEEMPMEKEPTAVYNAGANYVIVCYSNDGYLVRKSDGAVFSLKDVGLPSGWGHFLNDNVIKQDMYGNIYYHTTTSNPYRGFIIKIDTSNPSSLIRTVYSPSSDDVRSWDLTPDGHLVYEYGGSGNYRIRKANGGLFNLPDHIVYQGNNWIGLDNRIRYIYGNDLVTIIIDQNYNVTTQTFVTDCGGGSGGGYIIRFNNRILFTHHVSGSNSYIYEMENPENEPRKIDFSSYLYRINNVGNSSSFYYLFGSKNSGEPILLKVNPQTDEVTTILQNQYDIYKMIVFPDDIITFNALQMSNGATVIGEISSSGQVKILDTTLNTEVIVLERIK
jgi:hypothetical protein